MNSVTEVDQAPQRPKKNMSPRQIAANQANALKSTGPRTGEGKSISRFNNLKHGLCCFVICLPGEDKEVFEALRAEYRNTFRPRNVVEEGLVDDLVSCRWRKTRIVRTENGLVREQMLQDREQTQAGYDTLSVDVEVSLAMKSLTDKSRIADRIDRYEARMERNFNRTLRLLLELQRHTPPAADSDCDSDFELTTHHPQLTTEQTEPKHHELLRTPGDENGEVVRYRCAHRMGVGVGEKFVLGLKVRPRNPS